MSAVVPELKYLLITTLGFPALLTLVPGTEKYTVANMTLIDRARRNRVLD
jgi:hypothetical protein